MFIGCCDLNFEKEAYLAFELGLKAVDPAFTMTYVPTGDFPFDFDNTADATEALNARSPRAPTPSTRTWAAHTSRSCKLANESRHHHDDGRFVDGLRATPRTSTTTIAVRFDGGDYLDADPQGDRRRRVQRGRHPACSTSASTRSRAP